MPFKQGNKLGGRTVGTKTKKTKQWELLGEKITDHYTKRVDEYMDGLEGKAFFEAYCNLLEYFKPKLQRSEVDQRTVHDFTALSDKELEMVNELIERID